MYAQNENTTSTESLARAYVTASWLPFARRHPAFVITVRAVVAVWLVALGTFLMSRGYEFGSLIYFAAALDVALAYRVYKMSQAAQC
jgi:hypothetical protein